MRNLFQWHFFQCMRHIVKGQNAWNFLFFLFWSSLLATEGVEPVEYLFNLFDFVICIHFFLHLFLHFSFYFDLIELYESRRSGRLSCPRGLISRHVDPNLKRLWNFLCFFDMYENIWLRVGDLQTSCLTPSTLEAHARCLLCSRTVFDHIWAP